MALVAAAVAVAAVAVAAVAVAVVVTMQHGPLGPSPATADLHPSVAPHQPII